jgi:hypothetical protein
MGVLPMQSVPIPTDVVSAIRVRCTTLCDKVCQWHAAGWWFSPGPLVPSTNKTDISIDTESKWENLTRGGGVCGIKKISRKKWFDWCLESTQSINVIHLAEPLSKIVQLYRGCQFYWWREPQVPEKTTNLPL